jgi:hypothetical protein
MHTGLPSNVEFTVTQVEDGRCALEADGYGSNINYGNGRIHMNCVDIPTPLKPKPEKDVKYTAWYCPKCSDTSFVCYMATQKDVDEHMATFHKSKPEKVSVPKKIDKKYIRSVNWTGASKLLALKYNEMVTYLLSKEK